MKVVLIDQENREAFRKLMTREAFYRFSVKKNVYCLGAVCGGEAAGALAGYPDGDVFRIISLFVIPSLRRQGAATRLIHTLEEELKGEARLISARFSVTDPEQESLLPFFKKTGFLNDDHGGKNIYFVPISEISEKLDQFREVLEKKKAPEGLLRLSEISPEDTAKIKKQITELKIPVPEGGIGSEGLKADLSYIILRKGELLGYCFIDYSLMDFPTIAALWIKKSHESALVHILYRTLNSVIDSNPEESYIGMTAVTDSSVAFIRKNLPDAIAVSYTYYKVI